MNESVIQKRVLAWYDRCGRKDLPWQMEATPYRVWVSEIMLQQTRVATVIPYFNRFMQSFPTLQTLALASEDEVLRHWSGLGYYARARNLHRAACAICEHYAGCFPQRMEQVQALPGIGRSTAGAVLSLALGQRQPILDGNVKRVLARCFAVAGWPGSRAVATRLWEYAERLTPRARVAAYNQAVMDLGATLCTARQPRCLKCPLQGLCQAHIQGAQQEYPGRRPRRKLPVRSTRMLIIRNSRGEVLLQRRPPAGIWGGLWSFPECPTAVDIPQWCREHLGVDARELENRAPRRHSFSHFHLDIEPVEVSAGGEASALAEHDRHVWCDPGALGARGFAAPVARLIAECCEPGDRRDL